MLDFLGERLQKSMARMAAKTTLTEADLLEVSREIKMALLEADVNLHVVKEFVNAVKEKAIGAQLIGKLNPSQQMIKIVRDELVDVLGSTTTEFNIKAKPTIVMMVGLQGSGKTTTTAKIANFMRKKGLSSKSLIVAADIYRPAAIDQLKVLGKELQIDVFALDQSVNPRDIALQAVAKAQAENYDFVVLDTAGRLAIDESLMTELVDIKKLVRPHEILFVTDAFAGQDIINVATTFHQHLNLTGSIITKLDSDARGGAALSIRKMLNIPIRFIGTGERSSALDLFHPDRMAERILGMGDVLTLIEKAEDVIDEKASKRMMNRMVTGKFDLNDLIDQLQQMRRMGKMSKVMKLIPGLTDKINDAQMDSAEAKLALYEILISSMTNKERKDPRLLKEASRKARIIKGSGRSAQEYNRLINDFERMKKQMTEMAKAFKSGRFNPGMIGGLGL